MTTLDLHCIHAKAGRWKKVATCWNNRYDQAVQALHVQDLMVHFPIQREEPEGLNVADMVRAAYKIKMAILQLDPVEHLLVVYANRDRWAPVRANLVRQTSSLGSVPKSTARHGVRCNIGV